MNTRHPSFEELAVKTVTFTLAPIAIVTIGIALLIEGRFSDAYTWFCGGWRTPR